MDSSDLLFSAALTAAAAIGWLELRYWWRPLPAPGTLSRRLRGAGPQPEAAVSRRAIPRWVQALTTGLAAGFVLAVLTGSLFVAAAAALVAGLGTGYLLPSWRRHRQQEQARGELRLALDQLVVALRAGRSLPMALQEWPDTFARAAGSRHPLLLSEIRRIRDDLAHGATAEETLAGLAERVPLEETQVLSRVVSLCRRRGGDLGQTVAQTAQMLAEKLEVAGQIRTLTAGKRAEAWVITLSTPVILTLIALESPDYVLPLVSSGTGRVMLALSLVMQAAAFLLGRWLLHAEV